MKIGLMDSGLGGLTVLDELSKKYKGLELIYFADQKNCPYGEKTATEIEKAVRNVMGFFVSKKVNMIIIACNTATAIMLKKLQNEMPIPVIGVIEPGSQMAAESTKNNKVAVWATKKTIETNIYAQKIKEKKDDITVFSYKCEEFVPLIEADNQEALEQVIEKYVLSIIENDVDTVVLGCTHYPLEKDLIDKKIKQNTMKKINIVNPAIRTIESISQYIKGNSLKENKIEYYTSGNEEVFSEQLKNINKRLKVMEEII